MAALLCLSGCSPINRVLNEKQLQDMLIEQFPESIERDVQNETTNNSITLTAHILEHTWSNGKLTDRQISSKNITLDVSSSNREMEVLYENGDSISIGFEVESGLYLHVRKFGGDEPIDMKRSFEPRKS